MKIINRAIGVTHVLSVASCGYLDLYLLQQPIVANNNIFQISLTDSLLLSIFLFSVIFIGNIFGSFASFFNFTIYPLLTLGLGLAGLLALLLFSKTMSLFLILFGTICLFQIVVSGWEIFRSTILMKIGD
ncbi:MULTISPECIES: hypothetical protein [Enterococcus]|uniref:hypothetical protein n=1 Tax=Enterococcus TaxID=1350 RepID=UPI002E9DEF7F|nr:hypothetical protein [Enterococcus hirae]